MIDMAEVFIGYDPRENEAFEVCRHSIHRRSSVPVHSAPIRLADVRARGLYWRKHTKRGVQLWDDISDAPMATEFSNSRFLTPFLASDDWALFCDCDFLFLEDIARLFDQADPHYAVMCVKHEHAPNETVKMDGQMQTIYRRKNWSSLMLFNTRHKGNKRLTVEMVNTLPGRDLHRFCWLEDDEIGALDPGWNYIPGVTPEGVIPAAIHYSVEAPWFTDQGNCDFAEEWRNELAVLNAFRDSLHNG